jgi:hypothetical protein
MSACIFLASGSRFDPVRFLRSSTWPTGSLFNPGKHLGIGDVANVPALNITVADGKMLRQITAAMAFLDQHRDELTRLKSWSGLQELTLQFGWACPYGRSCRIDHRFPAELVAGCGEFQIGIEVLLYFVDPLQTASTEFEHICLD